MIEASMYFVLGMVVAALLALMIMPAVWRRAVRLTRRQIEGSIPLTLSEIQADKDQLRAEFAMTTRRLEMNIDTLQEKASKQLVELNRKQETMRHLALEQGDKEEVIAVLEKRETELHDKLLAQQAILAETTKKAQDAEQLLAQKTEALSKLQQEAGEARQLAESRQIEIVTNAAQLSSMSSEVAELKTKQSEDASAVADLEAQLADSKNATRAAEKQNFALQDRVDDLIAQLEQRDSSIAEQTDKLAQLRKERTDATRETESLNTEILDLQDKAVAADVSVAKLSAELQSTRISTEKVGTDHIERIKQLEDERKALMAEVEDIRAATVDDWQTEKMDAAILRERLNDVAAKVAVLTASIDGPSSPIQQMIDDVNIEPRGRKSDASSGPERSGLAQRILALQNQSG